MPPKDIPLSAQTPKDGVSQALDVPPGTELAHVESAELNSLSDLDPELVANTIKDLVEFDAVLTDHGLSLKDVLTDLVRRSLGILI